MALAGQTYEGREGSASYITYLIASSVPVYVFLLRHLFKNRFISIPHLLVISLPVILLATFLADQVFGRTQSSTSQHFTLALLFACPAAVAGLIAAQPPITAKLAIAAEPIMLVFTSAVILAAINTLGGGVDRGIGGATYQTAAYVGAVAYTYNLYYILFGQNLLRFRLFRTRPYFIMSCILLPIQGFAVLVAGGRGAFILVGIGTLILIVLAVRPRRLKALTRLAVLLILALPILAWAIPIFRSNPLTEALLGRVFAYVGEDGIDWDGTSGRDRVYSEAFAYLDESPVFGYGIFSWGMDTYPHNVFLELMLNGGIIYTASWLVLMLWSLFKLVSILRRSEYPPQILPLALYPTVMLQFSGSYLIQGAFWFVIVYLIAVKDDIS